MNHSPYQVMPPLSADEYSALKADISARGVQIAVEYDDRGNILDGHHRVQICEELGIVHWPKQVRQGLSEHEKRHHARRLNLERRHLDREARRILIAQELRERPQASDRAIADGLNVDHKTVGSVRADLEAGGEIPHVEEREGADGKSYPSPLPETPRDAPHLPYGARAVMGSRVEPADSLDFLPTPPWATRALMEKVFHAMGWCGGMGKQTVWEPACGEGHIAEVLGEYFTEVLATDVHDYGYGEVGPLDFLGDSASPEFLGEPFWDWIITNPPFDDKAEKFAVRALELARVGVAIFVPLRWLETIGRYERLFSKQPPTLISFFAERVNLCKGRWDPEGSTATAYIWLVWDKTRREPRAPYWIPPGQREALTRPDDAARFTAHPVIKRESLPPHDPETGEITDGAPQMGAVTQPAPGRCPATASSISAAKGAGHPSVDSYEIPPWLKRTA